LKHFRPANSYQPRLKMLQAPQAEGLGGISI
jgi:hypothetical protein